MAIDIIGSAPFRAPVLVRIGHGSSERVESASDAMHYLKHRWPTDQGRHYMRALADCRQAADGVLPAEVAKESFISAAIEAYILAQ